MSKKTPKVLFVSHDASRTGAPILLLNFLRWLKENTHTSFLTLLRQGGDLEPEFRAIAPTFVFNANAPGAFTGGLARLVVQGIASYAHLNEIKRKLVRENIRLIYANTTATGQVIEFLSGFLDCPVLCHVHELECGIRDYAGPVNIQIVKKRSQKYVAASHAVQQNLIETHEIPIESIDIVHEFIPTQPRADEREQHYRQRIREELQLPAETRIICASGAIEWRKGPDLFILLARAMYQRAIGLALCFVWMGSRRNEADFEHLLHDVNVLGFQKYVRFIGEKPNPTDYLAGCDIFALMSREDPFPLVMLEAAAMGKPIVCFAGSGGATEFIGQDCGLVVPYLDIEAMATEITNLLNTPDLYESCRRRAKNRVVERHHISVAAPKLLSVIDGFLR